MRLRGLRALGFHMRRQALIGPYLAEFACHGAKLLIEVNGRQHEEEAAFAHDRARDRRLASQGELRSAALMCSGMRTMSRARFWIG